MRMSERLKTGNKKQKLKKIVYTGGALLIFMVLALFIADVAIRYPGGVSAFSEWMRAHRSGCSGVCAFISCWAGVSGVLYMRRDSGRNTASH